MQFSRLNWRIREFLSSVARPLFHLGVRVSPHIAGKLNPLAAHASEFVLPFAEPEDVPPQDLWVGYAETVDDYIADGKADMDSVVSLLAKCGIETPRTVLDLGCAAGRMTRHFPRGKDSEIWGADISAPHITWCQRNLPELSFVTVTTVPHLPFPDGHFDFVFCASLFTHITDLADAWLLEIRRVLRPGGHLYLTIHDKMSASEMRTTYADGLSASTIKRLNTLAHQGAVGEDWNMYFFDSDPASQVFYDRDFITRKWSRWMRLVTYEPQFHNYQSAMLLKKV